MPFDWLKFCQRHRIPYVTSGPNTKRGNLGIKCPFCGDADSSEHMGLSLTSAKWGCWRNAQHRSSDPTRLVQQLLGCSRAQAESLVERQVSTVPDEFDTRLALLRNGPEVEQSVDLHPLEILMFEESRNDWGRAQSLPYLTYLEARGFKYPEALAKKKNLFYARTGLYQQRIIFPIEMDKVLVGWTARAIRNDVELRYKTSPFLPDAAIYNEAVAKEKLAQSTAEILFFVEGPFDALKLEVLFPEFAVVGLLGAATSPRKTLRAVSFAKCARFVVCLWDPDAANIGRRFTQYLQEVGGINAACLTRLPGGVKDPGDLDVHHKPQFRALLKKVLPT